MLHIWHTSLLCGHWPLAGINQPPRSFVLFWQCMKPTCCHQVNMLRHVQLVAAAQSHHSREQLKSLYVMKWSRFAHVHTLCFLCCRKRWTATPWCRHSSINWPTTPTSPRGRKSTRRPTTTRGPKRKRSRCRRRQHSLSLPFNCIA